MNETMEPRARKGLFRAKALERYYGPLQADMPHNLPPWRPGFVFAATAVGICVALLWALPD